ncbi:DUF1269 domain-containing protein [Roseimaritima ulvae]|uniref:DUF1269 domain-containing protein n=1 Tax=Roseimaritima ulvae TaxID=980254 RepID=A0A5B9QN05_9BACT|nr:DUF1269 domain-containing protein [Roseimaritima ulvae]QEG40477.1 hypothetical protein UC8_24890 [Roseimaritima ulvae]
MDSVKQCVVAEYASMSDADLGLKVLETADFTPETVSVVSRSEQGASNEAGRLDDTVADSPPADASIGMGGAVGGTLGAVLGAASMIGPFMVVGPLLGAAAGAGAGGLLGATEQWGVGEDDTRGYEQRVQEGAVLVIVSDTSRRLTEAERLLQTTDPESLRRFEG